MGIVYICVLLAMPLYAAMCYILSSRHSGKTNLLHLSCVFWLIKTNQVNLFILSDTCTSCFEFGSLLVHYWIEKWWKVMSTCVWVNPQKWLKTWYNGYLCKDMTSLSDNSSLVIPTNGGGFWTASFLLSLYAKMLKNGLTPWFGDIAQFAWKIFE